MSGGTFDILDFKINRFYCDIEEYLSEKALAEYAWTQDMQDIMREAQRHAQVLAIVVHRIDYVIAGDSSQDNILDRIVDDMKKEGFAVRIEEAKSVTPEEWNQFVDGFSFVPKKEWFVTRRN